MSNGNRPAAMMVAPTGDYRMVLRRELAKRQQAQSDYSLRAFAGDLGLPASRLSEVLSGKQGLSRQKAESIARTLQLSKKDSEIFCDLIDAEHGRSQATRDLARIRLQQHQSNGEFHEMRADALEALSGWYHFAILQLLKVKGAPQDADGIGHALRIAPDDAQTALERLERLALIRRLDDGAWEVLQEYVSVDDPVPAETIRKFHRELLGRAFDALEEQPPSQRDFSVMMMPMSREAMETARKWLKRFRRRFCWRMNEEQPDSLYCLAVQFFDLAPGLPTSADGNPSRSAEEGVKEKV